MTFAAKVESVGTTPVAILMNEGGSRVGLSYLVRKTGTSDVWLSGSDVNVTTKGFPLHANGEAVTINLNKSDTLYAVAAASTTSTIALLKQDD